MSGARAKRIEGLRGADINAATQHLASVFSGVSARRLRFKIGDNFERK